MQSILVIIIVVAAALFVGWRTYKNIQKAKKGSCECDCSGCDPTVVSKSANQCNQTKNRI